MNAEDRRVYKLGELIDEESGCVISYQEYFEGLGYSPEDTLYIRVFYEDKKSIEEYEKRFYETYHRKPKKEEKYNPLHVKANKSVKVKHFDRLVESDLLLQNSNGYGVFLVVNGGGQNASDVKSSTSPKAQFFEMDEKSIEEQLELIGKFGIAPSIVVRTKKSLHTYFRINSESNWDTWTDIEKRLIQKFDADSSICDASRVMRIPGFYHNKDKENPIMVRCVSFHPERVYSQNQISQYLPIIEKKENHSNSYQHRNPDTLSKEQKWLEEWLDRHHIEYEKRNRTLSNDGSEVIKYELQNEEDIPWRNEYSVGWTSGETIIFIRPDGNICIGGSHSTDSSHTWHEFREYHEPTAYKNNEQEKSQRDSEKKKTIKPLTLTSARALKNAELPEIKYVVENVIPQGTTILAAPPKSGKSWLMLQLCLNVASGENWLGFQTRRCSVLYLAMEDGDNFEQNRLNKILKEQDAPENFHYVFSDVATMDTGLIEQLDMVLNEVPDLGLIVIDTLAYVKHQQKRAETAYECDYRTGKELKAWADAHRLATVIVTHTTKLTHPEDPFSNVNGTMGVTGSADAISVIVREKRFDTEATFAVTGRRVPMEEYKVSWNKESCLWSMVGAIDSSDNSEERKQYAEYIKSDIRKAVIQIALRNVPDWEGTAGQIVDAAAELGIFVTKTKKEVGGFMCNMIPLFGRYDQIQIKRISSGHGSSQYRIKYFGSGEQMKIE